MEIYLNIGHFDFLANVRMLKFGSELRYGIRSPNVRTPVDIPNIFSNALRNYDTILRTFQSPLVNSTAIRYNVSYKYISDILRQGVDSLAQWLEHWISTPAVRVRIPSGTWDFFQTMHHILVTNFYIRKTLHLD